MKSHSMSLRWSFHFPGSKPQVIACPSFMIVTKVSGSWSGMGSGSRKKPPWAGITVIDNIDDSTVRPGMEMPEGRIGYLLKGIFTSVDYLELPPDLFFSEVPCNYERIMYTVRGKWVLCSEGRRRILEAGTLCRIGAGIPAGYEVPFDNASLLLVFRASGNASDEEQLVDYYTDLALRAKKMQCAGTVLRISRLSEGHPARIFASGLDRISLYEQYGKN